jgi:putative lipoic acid-binding regulatory protein
MNDTPNPNGTLSREELLAVLRESYIFPGMYPITVIARSDLAFYAHLHVALEELQGESSFTVDERPSSKKNFTSYRIEIFVESAETALYRKEAIGKVDGVLVML